MVNHNEDLRKLPEYEALQESWKRFYRKKMLCSAWKDFDAFFKWAIKSGYEIGVKIKRYDTGKPASPSNCYLVFEKDKAMMQAKGGWENRPCNRCLNERYYGCTNYDSCIRYKNWLNKSWEDFRRIYNGEG